MIDIETMIYWKIMTDNKYRHKRGKENKQTTKIQDFLDDFGKGIPPCMIKTIRNKIKG